VSLLRTVSTARLLALLAGLLAVVAGGTAIAVAASGGGTPPPPRPLASAVHDALTGAFTALGVEALLKPTVDPAAAEAPGGPAGICFQRAELFDVIHGRTGAKIAGGAQKRNKRGLLFQGSVWKPAAGAVDWDRFAEAFVARLAATLGAEASPVPWPELEEGELEGLTERYASAEWMELR